jgi:hypothetical protein
MTNVKKVEGQNIHMNAHAAKVIARGDKRVGTLQLNNVAIVPNTTADIVSVSKFCRDRHKTHGGIVKVILDHDGGAIHDNGQRTKIDIGRNGLYTINATDEHNKAYLTAKADSQHHGDLPWIFGDTVEANTPMPAPGDDNASVDCDMLATSGLEDRITEWMAGEATTEDIIDFIHGPGHYHLDKIKTMIRFGRINLPPPLNKEILSWKQHLSRTSCPLTSGTKVHPRRRKRETGLKDPPWTGDLTGPAPVRTHQGHRWGNQVVAPSGMGFFNTQAKKKSTTASYKDNQRRWEAVEGKKMRVHSSDRGTEYTGNKFRKLMIKRGVVQNFSAPGSSAGVTEKRIREVQEKGGANMRTSGAPESMWGEAHTHANDTINMTPSEAAGLDGKKSLGKRNR